MVTLLGFATLSGFSGPCQVGHDHGAHSGRAPSATASAPPPRVPGTEPRHGDPPTVDPHAGHGAPAGSGATPPGYGHVPLEAVPWPELGFATAKAEKKPLTRRIRTTGWVTIDETVTSHVHAKVRGFVVASHGRFVGSTVKKGDPLVSLYSEGILAAELELLSLVQQQQELQAAAPGPGVGRSLDRVVDAARNRFSLWDVSPGQVARVERSGKPTRGLTLSSPRDGVILARGTLDGMYVEPSTDLFVISDVSRLWIVFDVFEGDMPHVRLGQHATFQCEGMTHPHHAEISYLSPTIDPATRSLRARASVDNQHGTLRPGAYSTVEIDVDLGESLVVPEDAVLRTGVRDLVFVVKDGMAMPREVMVTRGANGLARIEHGLAEGDLVVSGAQFLVDSESRLRVGSGSAHVH